MGADSAPFPTSLSSSIIHSAGILRAATRIKERRKRTQRIELAPPALKVAYTIN